MGFWIAAGRGGGAWAGGDFCEKVDQDGTDRMNMQAQFFVGVHDSGSVFSDVCAKFFYVILRSAMFDMQVYFSACRRCVVQSVMCTVSCVKGEL